MSTGSPAHSLLTRPLSVHPVRPRLHSAISNGSLFAGYIHLGGERHCESEVSCPRTQFPFIVGVESRLLDLKMSAPGGHCASYKTCIQNIKKGFVRFW